MTTPDSTARSDSALGGDSSGALPSARAATASPPSPSVSGIAGIANSPSNLTICDHGTHQGYHTQLEELAVKLLLESGRIKFVEGTGYVET